MVQECEWCFTWPAKFTVDEFNIIMMAAALRDDADLRIHSRTYVPQISIVSSGVF